MFAMKTPTAGSVSAQRSVQRPAAPARLSCQTQAQRQDIVVQRQAENAPDRRQLLAGIAALSFLSSRPAQASSYKSELCVLQDSGEAADECRRSVINQNPIQKESYSAAADRKSGAPVSGVPVAVLDSEYVRSSKALIEKLEEYCNPSDNAKERIALSKQLKLDALAWVGKYARGGSARTESARRLYIAVDGVIGFLASNGLAPYPKAKAKLTEKTLNQALTLLEEGK